MSSTIFPTIFIGIGSTGAQILASLQKHLFEEYQVEDFPIFHLLGLITDESDKGKANDIYKIDWCHLKIENINIIKNSYNKPTLDWEKNLRKWLPTSIFNQTQFTDGSGAKRVAGRLHLWANYETVREKIRNAVKKITDSNAEVQKIIQQKSNRDITIDKQIKVYVL